MVGYVFGAKCKFKVAFEIFRKGGRCDKSNSISDRNTLLLILPTGRLLLKHLQPIDLCLINVSFFGGLIIEKPINNPSLILIYAGRVSLGYIVKKCYVMRVW